jgi:hypothetical protein
LPSRCAVGELQRRAHAKREGLGGTRPGKRLFNVQAVIALVRAPKSRMVDHALMMFYEGERERFEVLDWALDQHTARGRRLGCGTEHLLAEGAVLANESDLDDPYADEGRKARSRS